MNINQNTYQFGNSITNSNIQRSTFKINSQHKTTFNAASLIPIYVQEILPGDTFNMSLSYVIRQTTLIKPVMDNLNFDLYAFFVPNRLTMPDWPKVMGENKNSAWFPEIPTLVPTLKSPDKTGWSNGTIADYLGIPTQIPNLEVNRLPFNCYGLIYNEWFRNQNLQDPIVIMLDNVNYNGTNGFNMYKDPVLGGFPAKVNKYSDYFTSALPSPQKGNPVTINLTGMSELHTKPIQSTTDDGIPRITGNVYNVTNDAPVLFDHSINGTAITNQVRNIATNTRYNSGPFSNDISIPMVSKTDNSLSSGYQDLKMNPINLYADLSTSGALFNINDLRFAFQLQKMLERDSRGGTRYTEIIRSHFGVLSPDARMQRPEYLGGFRNPINVNQVLQTSESTQSGTPQANLAAFSLTSDSKFLFNKSFTEHGFIMILCCVRYEHTYQQGLEKFWTRRARLDYYDPVFANIGEQPIYKSEIYATGKNDEDNQVFGYQEAWADYRFKPNRVSSLFRSNFQNGLDFWHYADYYDKAPTLSAEWSLETEKNIDRTIVISSNYVHQFIADFYFQLTASRPMPVYSVPGLIDHN